MLLWNGTETKEQDRLGDASDLRYRLLIAVLESADQNAVPPEAEAAGEPAQEANDVAECALSL